MWRRHPGAQAREMVSAHKAAANLRAGAGIQHDPLWVRPQGYPLGVAAHKDQWLQARGFESDTGWIFRPLVGRQPHHVAKGAVVNLRSTPGARSHTVDKALRGEVPRTMGRGTQSGKVPQEGGLGGWVASRLQWLS